MKNEGNEKIRVWNMAELGDDKQDYIDDFNTTLKEAGDDDRVIDCEIVEHYVDRMGNKVVDCIFTLETN